MKIEIKHRYDRSVLFVLEIGSLKLAVEAAVASRADLSRADLPGADLPGADLSGANLSGADLSGANLSGANLSGANLYRANLHGAKFDEKTVLDTGETWGEYLREVAPVLQVMLALGGEVTLFARPRYEQFVRFQHAGLIPRTVVHVGDTEKTR